jgi:steroid 5-alpha reductase family enzyme
MKSIMASIENMLVATGISVIILFLYIIVAFIVCSIKKNNGLMDVFYGPGYFITSITALIVSLLLGNSLTVRQVIMNTLVGLWAARLALYVYIRNRGKEEDYRYARRRNEWKRFLLQSFFRQFLFQGVVIIIVGIPSWFVNISEDQPIDSLYSFNGITLWLGTLIWLIGFIFETIGDWSLYKFLQNPQNKGKVMDKGLWKYTQHPNYFGEITQWWGLFIIALAVPYGFITIIGPLYITFQIIKVSGVRLLEKHFEENEEYQAYKKRTSSFIPWFPKKFKINK